MLGCLICCSTYFFLVNQARNTSKSPARLAIVQHERNVHSRMHLLNGHTPQMLFLSADTQNALTTVVAGLALTIITLPNVSFSGLASACLQHAEVWDGDLPALLTSLVAPSAKVSSNLHNAGFTSVVAARAAAMPDFDTAAPAFIPGFIARGAIARKGLCWSTSEHKNFARVVKGYGYVLSL